MLLLLLVTSVRAAPTTACVGGSGCFPEIAVALTESQADRIEVHARAAAYAPFVVERDVTIVGVDPSPPVILADWTTGLLDVAVWVDQAHVTLEHLELQGMIGATTAGSLVLTDLYVHDRLLCGSVAAGSLTVSGGAFERCGAGLYVEAEQTSIVGTRFTENGTPVLEVVGGNVALHDLVVSGNGGLLTSAPVHLRGLRGLNIERSWFCDNGTLSESSGALDVSGSCEDGCTVAHSVFTDNAAFDGGAIRWTGDGRIEHSTFSGNFALAGSAIDRRGAGALVLASSLVLSDDPYGIPVLASDPYGELVLEDDAIWAASGPLPPGDYLTLDHAPTPFDGYVPPACGLGVTLEPRDPDNGAVLELGALTGACGPWCDDADGDRVPAMWDCGPDDATVGIGLPEVGGDGIDQDCDGLDTCYEDLDGDGFGAVAGAVPLGTPCPLDLQVGGDCADRDPALHPGAEEVPGDGVDQDCDGFESCYADRDGDGFTGSDRVPGPLDCGEPGLAATSGGDCRDGDPRVVRCDTRLGGGSCAIGPTGSASALAWLAAAALVRRTTRAPRERDAV